MRGGVNPDCQYAADETFESSVMPNGRGNDIVPDRGNFTELPDTLFEFVFDEHSERLGDGHGTEARLALFPNRP